MLVGEHRLEHVREGARVGTSALRRRAQLLAARPDLEVVELRGNVDTRLRKLRRAARPTCSCSPPPGSSGSTAAARPAARSTARCSCRRPGRARSPCRRAPARAAADAAAAISHAAHLRLPARGARRGARARRELPHARRRPRRRRRRRLRLRGFAGLPDGSAWLSDELTAPGEDPEAAGAELGRRMLAAGAAELLRDAEAMAT